MSDEDDDPFERLGDVDREGDPFERLADEDVPSGNDEADHDDAGDGPSGDAESPQGDAADRSGRDGTDEPRVPDDPFAEFEREDQSPADEPTATESTAAEPETPANEADRTAVDPFSEEPDREGDPFGGGENVFERVDVGEVDTDEIWSSMTEDESDDAEPVAPDESRYAEVSKHAYCEQCEYFSEPPEAHCTHESAEIIEYLQMDRVRLLDCPIVAERAELE